MAQQAPTGSYSFTPTGYAVGPQGMPMPEMRVGNVTLYGPPSHVAPDLPYPFDIYNSPDPFFGTERSYTGNRNFHGPGGWGYGSASYRSGPERTYSRTYSRDDGCDYRDDRQDRYDSRRDDYYPAREYNAGPDYYDPNFARGATYSRYQPRGGNSRAAPAPAPEKRADIRKQEPAPERPAQPRSYDGPKPMPTPSAALSNWIVNISSATGMPNTAGRQSHIFSGKDVLDPCVEVSVGNQKKHTAVRLDAGSNAVWNEALRFGNIDANVTEGNLAVWDIDAGKNKLKDGDRYTPAKTDDLIGRAKFTLTEGPQSITILSSKNKACGVVNFEVSRA